MPRAQNQVWWPPLFHDATKPSQEKWVRLHDATETAVFMGEELEPGSNTEQARLRELPVAFLGEPLERQVKPEQEDGLPPD